VMWRPFPDQARGVHPAGGGFHRRAAPRGTGRHRAVRGVPPAVCLVNGSKSDWLRPPTRRSV